MFDPHDSMQGGYYNNSTNFDSPSTQQPSKAPANKRDQNVVPVTINQILTSADSGLKIGTQDITLVTICGIITRMQVASMKVTYVISDDTGSIEAHLWVEADTNGMNTGDSHLSNSLMSTSYSASISSGFNPAQQMVFDVVKKSSDPTGIPRTEVINALKGKLLPKNINDILAFMCGEGHIYTTIDEDHFQCTD
ncbi:replication protein A 32 kDa subunit isoform X2 [Schistocerca piceifrons]|uniref:replication protein A 32 kDa subunit isoform X2 n=1 Tax=Schistocerca piceifrons TaxID=274613 RepID=UPI001F5F6DCA|nr:replication protein A 32 kDa subunit isoform X2 [Schistocerca piceifrons]